MRKGKEKHAVVEELDVCEREREERASARSAEQR
jgi:hypothetical protein